MEMPLNYLLFEIQTLLLVGSLMLLTGSLAGLFIKNGLFAEGWGAFFTGTGKPSKDGEDSFHEKRRNRRVPSSALLELMDGSGNTLSESARLQDLSLKGACFQSPLVFQQGKHLQAHLHSPNEGILNITARVVWASPRASRILYGIEFLSVDPLHH